MRSCPDTDIDPILIRYRKLRQAKHNALIFSHSVLVGRCGDLIAGVYAGFHIERLWFGTWPRSLS